MFRVRFIQGPMNKVEKYQHLINLLVKQYVWHSPTKEALTFMSKQPDRRKQNNMSDIHQLKKHLRSCPNSPTEENKTNKMIFKMSSLFIIIPYVKRRETICYL